MRRLPPALSTLALVLAACNQVAPPVIDSFTAAPDSLVAGESATLTWEASGPSGTTLAISPGIGRVTGETGVTVTPDATTTYTLSATAGEDSVERSVTVTVVEDDRAPVADGAAFETLEDAPIAFRLSGSDPDGDPITFAIASEPEHGTLTGFHASTGEVAYTPDGDYAGRDEFTFTVGDGNARSLVATVIITITAVNDAPAVSIIQPRDGESRVPGSSITLTASASDPEDGDLASSVSWTSDLDGALGTGGSVTTDSLSKGTHTVAASVTDEAGESSAASITITVQSGFTDSGQSLGSLDGNGAALGDLDGDGDLDAFVTNPWGSDQVYLNDGAGIFTDGARVLDSSESAGAVLGDVDGDGDLDAVVQDSGGERHRIYLNGGGGTFTEGGQLLGNGGAALGDVDGDGDLDAVVGAYVYGGGFDEPAASSPVYLNDGTGTFTDSGEGLGPSYSAVLTDFDGDGDLDGLVEDDYGKRVHLNDGGGAFTQHDRLLGKGQAAVGDLDGDGDVDILVTLYAGELYQAYLNRGDGTFADGEQFSGTLGSSIAALGDLDGDGDPDAVIRDPEGRPPRIHLNDGAGSFAVSGQGLGPSDSRSLVLGDLDGDGDLDAFITAPDSHRVYLYH